MEHNNRRLIYLFFTVFLTFSLLTNCEDSYIDCSDFDSSDCISEEPYEAELRMKISQSLDYDSVRVILFKGVIEDNDTIDNYLAEFDEYYIWLNVDQEYSAIAKYYIGDQTIIVVDGDKLRTKLTSRCEYSCYIIKGDKLDLELKFNNIK